MNDKQRVSDFIEEHGTTDIETVQTHLDIDLKLLVKIIDELKEDSKISTSKIHKVYCKDCKFFSELYNALNNRGLDPTVPDCNKGIVYKGRDLPTKRITVSVGYKVNEKNANNDCKDYEKKRSWWKIWIRD